LTGTSVARAEQPTTAELVEQLGSDDRSVRSGAYRELRKRNEPDAPARLAARLPEFPLASQRLGVLVLDAYGKKVLAKPLRELLLCTSAYLRLCAAHKLDEQGAKRMVAVVATELGREDLPRETWTLMVRRLRNGRLPADDALVHTLLDPLVTGADAGAVREIARIMLDAESDAANPTYRALLNDERPGTRAVAAAFLRGRGQDRDGELAAAVRSVPLGSADVSALESILTRSGAPPVEPPIVDALIEATRPAQNHAALRSIVQLLGRLGDPRAVPRLEELTTHESRSVAQAAARAIVKLGGPDRRSGAKPAELGPRDTNTLAKMERDRDVAGLRAWLKDDDVARRLTAADTLRRMDDHAGLEVVLAELGAEDPVVRRKAASFAGDFRADAAVGPLIEALLDEDAVVRSSALIGLGRTLGTLFPQRRFRMSPRGATDPADVRTARVAHLRKWWATARDAPW
jgi:HEAT repeat protein